MPKFPKWREWAVPISILAGLFVILTPLPTLVVDFLLASNMIAAIMILSAALLARSATELSVFPAILLVSTLGRLVLNISTTRLILSNATTAQDLAAGGVVQGFGEFVMGNQVFVGLVIFSIIFIVQFVVVTKGSSRISEVAARFALDGMPGKQMAIDADLKARLIDAHQARESRRELQEQADFLGAMDGAGRFVRGDAIAGLIITLVNIVGGLGIGLSNGMSFSNAVEVYTKLTIGDGLASQLPAFLIAVAAGVLMARGSRPMSVSEELVTQVAADPRVFFLAGAGAISMVFAGLPPVPLFSIGAVCLFLGVRSFLRLQKEEQLQQEAQAAEVQQQKRAKASEQTFEQMMRVDSLEIRLGAGIVAIADPARGGTLFQQVNEVRKSLLGELGFILPKVRISDDIRLKENRFQIRLSGDVIAEGELLADSLLAVDRGNVKAPIHGKKSDMLRATFSQSPINQRLRSQWEACVWIDPSQEHRAQFMRYQVLTPVQVVIEVLRQSAVAFAADLFTRDSAGKMVDELARIAPVVVKELVPEKLSLSQVQQVLKNLLQEQVSIRQLALILEALGDYSPHTHRIEVLVENVRHRLSRNLCSRLAVGHVLHVFEFEPAIESRLVAHVDSQDRRLENYPGQEFGKGEFGKGEFGKDEIRWFANRINEQKLAGQETVLLVRSEIRRWVWEQLAPVCPTLHVLSRSEVCDGYEACRIAGLSLRPAVRSAA